MAARIREQLRLVVGGGNGFDLAEAALLVAAEEYPDLDVARELGRLRVLAAEGARRVWPARNPFARLSGMCDYLASCDCILAGGETAEMPGIVPADVIELSGFCIGCAEKPELIDPSALKVGDVLIGYKSDSIHANGWSLVRRVLKENPGCVSDEELRGFLEPTRLYHDVVRDIRAAGVKPKAYAHITGGGLPENLERLFRGFGADLEIPKWELAGTDKLLAHVDSEDRFHTFNMGIGWVAIVSPEEADKILSAGPGGTILGTLVDTEGVRVKVRGE